MSPLCERGHRHVQASLRLSRHHAHAKRWVEDGSTAWQKAARCIESRCLLSLRFRRRRTYSGDRAAFMVELRPLQYTLCFHEGNLTGETYNALFNNFFHEYVLFSWSLISQARFSIASQSVLFPLLWLRKVPPVFPQPRQLSRTNGHVSETNHCLTALSSSTSKATSHRCLVL